jgi:uncharacterized protein DUF4019
MLRFAPVLLACAFLAGPGARAQAPTPQDGVQEMDLTPAMAAASSWLAIVDLGLYGQSWEATALVFKDAVPRTQWEKSLQELRGALGPLASRKLASATYTRALPGAPAGEYVVIQYHSRFENRPLATEIVTPMRDRDGAWRVSGYFIR